MKLEALRIKIELILTSSDVANLHWLFIELPTEVRCGSGNILGVATLVWIQVVVLHKLDVSVNEFGQV